MLIEKSDIADAKMRIFNKDGSEGKMAGNSIRCVGKYLYDNGIVRRDELDIETASGIKHLKLYTQDGRVSSVCVDMGKADLSASSLPTTLKAERIIDYPVTIGGRLSHNLRVGGQPALRGVLRQGGRRGHRARRPAV